MPTHYGFVVSSKLDRIEQDYQKVLGTPSEKLWPSGQPKPPKMSRSLTEKATQAIATLDDRGAWVEAGEIATLDKSEVQTDVIESKTFIKNVATLAEYIAAKRSQE